MLKNSLKIMMEPESTLMTFNLSWLLFKIETLGAQSQEAVSIFWGRFTLHSSVLLY